MRIAYLSSRPLGEKILEFLISEQKKKGKNYIDIVCIVTLKEGKLEKSGVDRWWDDKIPEIAKDNNIPIVSVNSVPKYKPDIIFSVFYFDIIPQKILKSVKKGATNLHFGYLPNAKYHDKRAQKTYRGRGILSFAILNDEKWQAVTFHYITEKVDLGPIIEYAWNRIGKKTTVWDLQKKSEEKAFKMFKKWLPKIVKAKKMVKTLPPGNGKYHYYSNNELLKLKRINKSLPKVEKDRIMRAFAFPGREPAYLKLKINNKTKKIYLRSNR